MIIQCRQCSKKLKLPEKARGRKVRCPNCEAVLHVATAPEESGSSTATSETRPGPKKKRRPVAKKRPSRAADSESWDDNFGDLGGYQSDDDDLLYDNSPAAADDPYAPPRTRSTARPRSKGRSTEGLATVGTGLLIQGWCYAILVLAIPVLVIIMMTSRTAATAASIMWGFGMLTTLIGIVIVVGQFMCLKTPEKTGARGFIVGATACNAVAIVLNIAQRVLGQNRPMLVVIVIVSFAFQILFLLFLRKIAQYIGDDKNTQRATLLLMAIPASLALFGIFIAMTLLNIAGGTLALMLMVVAGIVSLVLFVMYVNLLFGLGKQL